MSYILAEQRDTDVVAAFKAYKEYLARHAESFPRSAFSLAASDWYFDPSDHRSPHDAWLVSATLSETPTQNREDDRSTTLVIGLLAANHDGYIEFAYPGLTSYQLDASEIPTGHGDWRYDEFRVADGGGVLHEIEWAKLRHSGRWLIESADVIHKWVPR